MNGSGLYTSTQSCHGMPCCFYIHEITSGGHRILSEACTSGGHRHPYTCTGHSFSLCNWLLLCGGSQRLSLKLYTMRRSKMLFAIIPRHCASELADTYNTRQMYKSYIYNIYIYMCVSGGKSYIYIYIYIYKRWSPPDLTRPISLRTVATRSPRHIYIYI